ncbi:MAG: hypothetical protein ACO3RV_01015 [Luteolibacter sp.]
MHIRPMSHTLWRYLLTPAACLLLLQCASLPPNLSGPEPEIRQAQIANEATGNFYYGRRYHVAKTRFWGYLREPRQSANHAKLVMMREDLKKVPDRLPEDGPPGERHGYDNNYEYRIHGYYTGRMAYDPNSNQFLPEFMLTGYQLLNRRPGWLFSPKDHYDPLRITLRPPGPASRVRNPISN